MYLIAYFKNIFQVSTLEDTSEQLFLGKKWKLMVMPEKLGIILIALSPTLYLGTRHWITNLSILAVIVVVYHLFQVREKLKVMHIPYSKAIILVFLVYIIAIIISQFGRYSFTYKPYLDQGRWVIGLPIFIFLYFVRINFAKILDWVAPISIFAAFVGSVYLNPSDAWGNRATVTHIDPIAFGFLNLSVGLMCIASVAIDIYKNNYSINTVVKFLAFFLGVYLSIRSGSRTGWAALPIVAILLFYILYRPKFWRGVLYSVFVSVVVFALYQLNNIVETRVDALLFELVQYPWLGGMAQDTSVGMRITFYRLGYYYFSHSPLFGWGERGFGEIKNAAELLTYSTQYSRDFAFSALFHSEWVTQSVQFGIFGLIGVFMVFMIPLKLFTNFLKLGDDYLKVACMGLAFMICQFTASLSYEVFNSKGIISFSAIIIAGLLATGLSLMGRTVDPKQNLNTR